MAIANKYIKDIGIAFDPAVVFAEDFEGTVSTWFARFNGGSSNNVSGDTEVPTDTGGIQSGKLLGTPDAVGGTLYKNLGAEHDELYIRCYIKFEGAISWHSGMFMGGYSPRQDFPQGDAGLKGVRPNGDKLFISSLEQWGTTDGGPDPNTRMDFYNNWVDMHGSGFGGLFFGEQSIITENLALSTAWRCYELRLKMNTTATGHEGEQQLWVDDVEIQWLKPESPTGSFNSSSGLWTTGAGSPYPGFQWRDTLAYGINWIKLQNYDPTGPTTYSMWIDDLVVATERIGILNTKRFGGTQGLSGLG